MKIRFLLNFIDLLSLRKKKSILLIRLDNIGDYILFRNFIEILKKDKVYKDYNITLCGNKAWKNLAESLDNHFVTNFIWINRGKYDSSSIYRNLMLIKIHFFRYDILIQPTYSRIAFIEEIAKEFNATTRVTSIGDNLFLSNDIKSKYNMHYSRIIEQKSLYLFEFKRNIEFFEYFLGYKLSIKKPFVDVNALPPLNYKITRKYVVIFPGASLKWKMWDLTKFVEVIKYLINNYSFQVYITGSRYEKPIAQEIMRLISDYNIYDLTGQTSLMELYSLINGSELLITNDSVPIHMAATLDKKAVCISNGNHYSRFIPYPEDMYSWGQFVFPKEIMDSNNYNNLLTKYYEKSSLNINLIDVNQVIESVNKLIN